MKQLLIPSVLLALTLATSVSAQNAYRCEVNGTTVYSEKPCPGGRVVAPTQESDAQKAQTADAARQLKADDKQLSRQINQRVNRETKERAAERKVAERARIAADKRARAERAAEAKKAKKAAKSKIQITKVKPAKPPKRTASAKPG